MRYHALACDYDGTLAHHGQVDDATLAALERCLATGRKLLLVTGRELDELLRIFPPINMFTWVVAENGALLYRPSDRQEKLLGAAPPAELVQKLQRRGVAPLATGRVILATWEPHETVVLETIRDLGLEHQVIFNKGAVMVLPAGITKATGLAAALGELGLSPHEVVGVGDAENDHAFLGLCEASVAVANALPAVKEHVDWVTSRDHGGGVADLIDALIADDLSNLAPNLSRHDLVLGMDGNGQEARLPSYGPGVLIAGPSGSGKSTTATSLLERLIEKHYQFCIIDPEGDYQGLEGAVTLGSPQRGPVIQEILEVLDKAGQNAVINLVGLTLTDRPSFFMGLLPRLLEMRARSGRPHWLVIDEAHHLLPAAWEPGVLAFPQDLMRTIFITVHPEQVAPAALAGVGFVLAVGKAPQKTLASFCAALSERPPKGADVALEAGEVLLWPRHPKKLPSRVRIAPCRTERRRHIRKYAEGELPPEKSFYFHGPEGKLNLRAQNLMLFLQLAEGVDEATWLFHLQRGDYSQWFREAIKNEELADEARAIEMQAGIASQESRAQMRSAIEKHYTLPASAPLPMPGTDAAPKEAKKN